MTKLFHSDIFIPTAILEKAKAVQFQKLAWSRHARLEIIRDPYGVLRANQIPHSFDGRRWELIELEADGEQITKYVFRRPVDATRSLVVVLRPAGRSDGLWTANVVTCWTNLNTDKHKSLDRSKYATPADWSRESERAGLSFSEDRR